MSRIGRRGVGSDEGPGEADTEDQAGYGVGVALVAMCSAVVVSIRRRQTT